MIVLGAWLYLRSEKFNNYVAEQIKTKLIDYGLRGEIGGTEISLKAQTAKLRDLKIYNDKSGQLLLSVKHIELACNVRDTYAISLSREIELRNLNIDGFDLHIDIDERGRTNLEGLRIPPSTPSSLTFDYSKLIASLTNGAVHYKDLSRKLEADLAELKIDAQPLSGDAKTIKLEAGSTAGKFGFEGRETKIESLDLAAAVSETGAGIERLIVKSGLTQTTATGKLENWKAPRYVFDFDSQASLGEIARLFIPDLDVKGSAAAKGRIDGQSAKFTIKSNIGIGDADFDDTKLRGIQIPQAVIEGNGNRFDFAANQVRAQTVIVDNVRVNDIALNNLKGESKEGRTQILTASGTVNSVEWPESNLANINLNGLSCILAKTNRDKIGYEIETDATVKEGSISGYRFNDASTKASFDNTALSLTGINGNVFGGVVTGEYILPIARGAAQTVKVAFTDLSTKDVVAALGSKSAQPVDVPLAGKISGDAEITFTGKNARSINGTINAHFDGKTNEATEAIPLTGEAVVKVQDGVFNFDRLQLLTDVSKLTAQGTLAVDGQSNLRLNLNSSQAEQFLQIARSLDVARPYITEYEPQINGDFKFDGALQTNGPIQSGGNFPFVVEGDINATSIGLKDALLGSLTGHLLISADEIRVEKGLISAQNGGSAKFDLITPFDPKASSGKLDATIERLSLESILAASGTPDTNRFISGDVSGEAHLTGLPGAINGKARLNMLNGKIVEQPAELATAEIKFDSKNAILDRLEVRLPQSHITASGEINLDDYKFKLNGKADQVSLEGLAQSFEIKDTTIEGTADADLVVSGKIITGKDPDLDWESLELYFLAQGQHVKVNGRDTGLLRLAAKTNAGGRIDFGLTTGILLVTPSSDVADNKDKPEVLRGSIELRKPGRPIIVEGELSDQKLTPIFDLFVPELKNTISGTINGKLRVEGPSADNKGDISFDKLSGGLTLTSVAIEVLETPIKIETPVTIALESMQVKINNTHFIGSGLDLNLGGAIGLKDNVPMNFTLKGAINLNQLPPISDGLLLNGTVAIDAKVRGTADSPDMNGTIDLNGFGVSSGDLPFFISGGEGHVTFSGDQIKLDIFKASANDGTLEAKGVMKLDKLRPKEWNYDIKTENATVDYQDVNANLSGTFTLTGNPQGQVLSGTIAVPQAEYSPGIDLDNILAAGSPGLGLTGFDSEGAGGQSLGIPPISLNLRVEARDSLIVRNDQINAVGSTSLAVTGTISDPTLTGRIQTDGGSVRFRGQRYEITVGTLDLPANNATPLLNLNAEGQVGGYRVTIGFVGPIDDIDLTLQSEPQLVRDEIIALITTGRTESGTLSSQDPLRSGVGAAASLLSSGFISKPTEQLLGLSRFQIDPVIRPNANPAARLTVGQQISRNVYLSYSTNLATEQDQTALGEYTISNRFSALATYTQGGSSTRQGVREGVFTIELRGRRRFDLGFKPDNQSVSTSSGANAGAANTNTAKDTLAGLSRLTLPEAKVEVSPVPNMKLSERKLKELLPVMTQGFSKSLARLGEKRLKEYLQEEGYFFAEVRSRCAPENCFGDDLKVFYDIEPNTLYDLKEIRIEGTGLIKLRDISGELQSQISSKVGGIPFLKDLPLIGGYVRGLTSNDRLKADEDLIRQQLLDIGFRNARVKPRLAVKPDNDDLLVIFEVEEGIQSDVAGVDMRGNTIISSEELRTALPIQPGEAYSYTRARAGVQQIKQLYAQNGFLEATAELELVNIDEDSVALVYKINEGARAVVSDIAINGLSKTGKGWVRRYFDFKNGDVLTPAKIRQTQRDLYATNAFREVTVRAESVGGDDGSAHKVSLDLTEAKPLLLVYGLGYSTDDGLRGLAEIANTNLLGSLDSLTLRLRGSRREQFSQLSFTDLRPFGSRLPTTLSVFYNRNTNLQPFVQRRILTADGTVEDSDELRGFGLQRFAAFIQTERKLSERTTMRIRYNLERASLFGIDPLTFPDTDLTRNERAIRLGMLSIGYTHDTRDSVLNPTRGLLFSADHSLAARIFGGNESFNKFFTTYQSYKTFDSDFPFLGNTTFAFSTRIGLGAMYRNSDRNNDNMIDESERRLPISERFFSGGATTLRGFRFETAGPQAILEPRDMPGNDRRCSTGVRPCDLPTLVPIGGDALTIFNFEMRYPLTQRFRLVPFYDLGNVFRTVKDINFSRMTNTIGLGLRINTPLGPVGVDYGILLDPPAYLTRDGAILRQPRGAFHVRLGQSF